MDAQLTIVDVTGSTNDDLLEAGKQGAPHGTGLAARAQTAGRGRRGHKWDSTAGNLLLSIVLRPCVNPAKYSGLAAVSGLAVLEALEKQGLANEIGLKWPNDLVARGRKLGGILVEAARDNEGKPFAVCGIGVNVNYTPQEVPDGAWRQLASRTSTRAFPPSTCSSMSLSRSYRRCRCLGRAPQRQGRRRRSARARPRRICRSPQLDRGARYRPLPRWRRAGTRHI